MSAPLVLDEAELSPDVLQLAVRLGVSAELPKVSEPIQLDVVRAAALLGSPIWDSYCTAASIPHAPLMSCPPL